MVFLKDFVPFWIDQDGDLENDPYTTDCSTETNMTHPHAYSDITIQNGQVQSKTCIKKQPGSIVRFFVFLAIFNFCFKNN